MAKVEITFADDCLDKATTFPGNTQPFCEEVAELSRRLKKASELLRHIGASKLADELEAMPK